MSRQLHRVGRLLNAAARSPFAAVVLVLALGAAPLAAQQVIEDADITRAVEDELWIDQMVDANGIDVSTSEGIVVLDGSVGTILAKDRAARIAESTVGVRAVVNRIEVEPGIQRDDAGLAKAVAQSLRDDPATAPYDLEVSADNGVVTLTGTVASWQARDLADTVARGVRGVTGVVNLLRAADTGERTDAEIEAEVEARLANDVRVDDYLIVVDVDDGKVHLSGTVGSLAEKNRAISMGWVSGVDAVDGDALEIEWWARDSMRRKTSFADRGDEELEQAVKDAFLYDPRVLSFRPEVSVSDGVVTLSGTVRDLAAKRAAEADARNVTGVWRVRNHIKVRPLDVDDESIEARLADVFFEDPILTRWDITIDSILGVVTLTGTVNTPYEQNRAEKLAERIDGVVEVINRLDHRYRWTPRPDWEIRADIKDQLWWSPFVDASEVMVEVDAGVATLSGEVETWGERQAAEQNAFEAGARAVRNDLTVVRRLYGPYPTYDLPLPPPFGS